MVSRLSRTVTEMMPLKLGAFSICPAMRATEPAFSVGSCCVLALVATPLMESMTMW